MKKRGTAILIKKIKILLTAFTFASLLLAQPRAYAEVAPPNPAFVKYMDQAERRTAAAKRLSPAANTAGEEKLRTGGYVPSPLNWSHLAGKTWRLPGDDAAQSGGAALARSAANSVDALPSKYDLRSEITPVRNQTSFGNCWTHSAMAATESNLLKKGLADAAALDLSEWYLTYYALNPCGGMPGFIDSSGDPYYLVGGNDWKAVALLSRGTGSVTTAKAPDITSYYEYDYATGATYEDYSQVYTPAVAARDYKLVNALYLGDFGAFEVQLSAERRDMIKRAVMQYGAVSVGIHMGGMNHDNYNSETGAYYSGLVYYVDDPKNGVTTDHAVAIVGWDDEYSRENFAEDKRPQNDGAWIIRNSWGESWGDGGYCYVSYEEATLCDGVAYDSEPAHSGETIYQYDPLGCLTWYFPGDPASVGDIVLYFANIFTARSDDRISTVAFYVPDENVEYEISLYTDCGADSPVNGTLAVMQTAESLVPGYNTVTLSSPVAVAAGTRFSVVVRAETPEDGYKFLAPLEYTMDGYADEAKAETGEGWLSTDGVNFYDILPIAESEGVSKASICLKAFGERIYAPVANTEVTVSGDAVSVSASVVAANDNEKIFGEDGLEKIVEKQGEIIDALNNEAVANVLPNSNVALLGSFGMNVAHSGGSATFTITLTEEMSFMGTPYVIIWNYTSRLYRAFRAEYHDKALTFTVGDLDAYFFTEQSSGIRSVTEDGSENSSYALVTIADVRTRYAAQPAHTSGGGSGGGCSAGWGPLALLAFIPLALKRKTK